MRRVWQWLLGAAMTAQAGVYGAAAADSLVDTVDDMKVLGYADSRKVVRDRSGRVYVAYRKKYGTGSPYRIFVRYQDEPGKAWKECNNGVPIDQGPYPNGVANQRVPSIAIGQGRNSGEQVLHVVWYGVNGPATDKHANNEQREIKYRRSVIDQKSPCQDFENEIPISQSSGYKDWYQFWQEHPVVIAYGNRVFIAWEGRDDQCPGVSDPGTTKDTVSPSGVVYLRSSSNAGRTFLAPNAIKRNCDFKMSRPAILANGPADDPRLYVLAHVRPAGGGDPAIQWIRSKPGTLLEWENWKPVCKSNWKICDGDNRHVSISRDSNGQVHAVWWRRNSESSSQVLYTKFDKGTFKEPSEVDSVGGKKKYRFFPQIEVDQANNDLVHVVWSETETDVKEEGDLDAWTENKPETPNFKLHGFHAVKSASAGEFKSVTPFGGSFVAYPRLRSTTETGGPVDLIWAEYAETDSKGNAQFKILHRKLK